VADLYKIKYILLWGIGCLKDLYEVSWTLNKSFTAHKFLSDFLFIHHHVLRPLAVT